MLRHASFTSSVSFLGFPSSAERVRETDRAVQDHSMSLLRRFGRKPRWDVVSPYPWGESLSPPAGNFRVGPEADALVEESSDWSWLGATLDAGEERLGRCPVFVHQANAEGKLFLTDRALYLGYAKTSKRYPLEDVRFFAPEPEDYGEVGLAVYFPEVRTIVPTHLRILDPASFSRFYPTAIELITATRSHAVLEHQKLMALRADHVRKVHEWLATVLRSGESVVAESWVGASSRLGDNRAEYWLLTDRRWFRNMGDDTYATERRDGMVARADGAPQHSYEFLTREHGGPWARTARIEPMMSPLTGVDDRWWEFFETLYAQSAPS